MTLSVSSKRFQGAEEYYKSEPGNLGRKCEGRREGLGSQGREDWLPEIGEMTGRSWATGKDWKTGTSKGEVEIVVLKERLGMRFGG